MLSPKRVKWRKQHRGQFGSQAKRGTELNFGEYALAAMQSGWLTSRQIESGRIAISRHVKRLGRLWIRVFPDRPITQKPAEVRMGSGKGNPEYWASKIEPGRIVYEISGVDEAVAKRAFALASSKLPFKTKVVQIR